MVDEVPNFLHVTFEQLASRGTLDPIQMQSLKNLRYTGPWMQVPNNVLSWIS